MRKNIEKTINKLRSKSIVAQIIFFLVAMCFSFFVAAVGIQGLSTLIVNSKYNTLYYDSSEYAELIREGLASGMDAETVVEAVRNAEKRPLALTITDSQGNVLAGYGENPDLNKDLVVELKNKRAIMVCLRSLMKRPGTGNSLREISLYDVFENFGTQTIVGVSLDKDFDADELDEVIEAQATDFAAGFSEGWNAVPKVIDDDSSTLIIEMTSGDRFFATEAFKSVFWISAEVGENEIVYVKNKFVIDGNDCFEITILAVLLILILIVACIARFVRSIANISSRRYFSNLILSDPVTGGKNELAFEMTTFKNLTMYRNRNYGYAIVDFSMEKYQNYCTLYGVEEGERLLQAFTKAFHSRMNKHEAVSRVSGGDFLLLLRDARPMDDSANITYRMQELLENLPNVIAEQNRKNPPGGLENLRFKAGLYYLPGVFDEDSKRRRDRRTLNVKSLCIKAGMAKNGISEDYGLMVYNHDMWEREIWEQKVEDMMLDALEREEFQVYIQPKYHPATEELMGGEALVRWISPTEGFISPGQFIPIFERTGFVTRLDDYMISHTAKLQSQWLAAGKKIVPVSVNVSRVHFAQPDLAEHIKSLVDAYPLPHKYIEIELTESAFFDDKNALLTTVRKLQEYGFEVSMDDFGSGYSSLNSLKDLPLNVLKLDAEFFRGEDMDGRGEIVVSEAIALAKQLNMRIVAEGVEKKEHVDFLAQQNCDMIQGYYFAKPMPANEYELRMSETPVENEQTQEEKPEEGKPEEEKPTESSDETEPTVNFVVVEPVKEVQAENPTDGE